VRDRGAFGVEREPLGPDSFGGTDEGSHLDNSAHVALREARERMASRDNGVSTRGGEAGCAARPADTCKIDQIGDGQAQQFATGATRSAADHKIDFEGHISPEVLTIYGDYMRRHRINRRTGETRASDNWQRGIPLPAYMKSLVRHMTDLWRVWRGRTVEDPDSPDGDAFTLGDLLCAIIFNAMGMLYELQKVGGQHKLYVTDDMRRALESGIANPAVFMTGAYPTSAAPQAKVTHGLNTCSPEQDSSRAMLERMRRSATELSRAIDAAEDATGANYRRDA
jgi:hypothetical protein